MKQLRPLIIGLPILLAGCSTLSNFSWSSLSPLSWFSGDTTVGDGGVGNISAATPLEHEALDKALDGKYRLRGGMETRNGGIVAFYQALKDDRVEMTIYGPQAGKVNRVDVTDKSVASAWGVKIGTPFESLYGKAFGACARGEGDDRVVCAAPQSGHVSYVFSGAWHGPDELMPSDDTLKTWQVSKIVWHADASR
ncbi:RpoE-regulated lipoprotein [Acerihabitans arboris]|uniref:RpoE-regulated lipoprotein n=1 Tax=Acerihabitans arboris TaxID=2691583 RepID=A0A845SN27_9GAMM|nr:RpoE-regulated lipoprotein [Acerihabitans arboris]NDL65429.1 RpoE-regulated lipoprotein [Acerihabitans arboris]